MEVEIVLDRQSKVYLEGDEVSGTLYITCGGGSGDQKHEGITVSLDGTASISNPPPKGNSGYALEPRIYQISYYNERN